MGSAASTKRVDVPFRSKFSNKERNRQMRSRASTNPVRTHRITAETAAPQPTAIRIPAGEVWVTALEANRNGG